ncbi:hypothetical protein JTB14_033150 [Gonioctena quinquepunctata]|nr:hypothetical protein JTB14_033150 [Gonioctena quinquepunctata]
MIEEILYNKRYNVYIPLLYHQCSGFPYLEPKLPLGTNKTLLAKFPGSNLENYGLYKEIRKKGYRFAGAFSITRPYLVIVDPEIVKDIMIKDFDYFCDRGFYYTPNDPITIHLFSMDGPEWKNTRTHFNSIFSSAKLKMLLPLVIRMGELMMQEIQYAAKVNENVDIKEVSTRYTMNTTATCAFGVECDDPKAFAETTQKYFTDEDFTRRVKLSIMNRFPDFAKKLGLKLSTEEISGFYNGILRNNVSYREKNNITRPDYLQSLINLKNETKNTPNPFTEDQIVAESFVFFLGSLDTGSNTISFALYELAQNPDIQEKVRHEIRKSSDIGDLLSLESLAEMKYLHQVINGRIISILEVFKKLAPIIEYTL